MKLLLDTHAWVWRLLEPERLSGPAEAAIADPRSTVHLSPISVWETLVLARRGRLRLDPGPAEWVTRALRRSATTPVPITNAIALRSEGLDDLGSRDPADRFLVASALEHDLVLITADGALRQYAPVTTLW